MRPRGQMVNEACQWIVEHHRLVIQLVVKPILFLALCAVIDLCYLKTTLIAAVAGIIGALIVPALPGIVMEVAENPEEYDYPNRIPRLMEVKGRWWYYFSKVLVITILGGIGSFVTSFTIVGPLIVQFVTPFAIVICQRDEDLGFFSSILKAFEYTFNNFANSLLVCLGIIIISISMIAGPVSSLYIFIMYLRQVLSQDVIKLLGIIVNYDGSPIIVMTVALGGVFAYMTSIVIFNFFYGHCVAKESEND